MITKQENRYVSDGASVATTVYGLSTDVKPTDVPNGSKFVEMDTDKKYLFDAENTTWYEV